MHLVLFDNIILFGKVTSKIIILNPKGRIWTMVAGGGASVIYDDTVNINLYPVFS
jgi:succinyl-CoA synthetase beta subunit